MDIVVSAGRVVGSETTSAKSCGYFNSLSQRSVKIPTPIPTSHNFHSAAPAKIVFGTTNVAEGAALRAIG
jgi:hypothetical protein